MGRCLLPPPCRILRPMNALFDAFWRAAAYCLHPRVIMLSLLPLLVLVLLAAGVGYFFWADAVTWARGALNSLTWLQPVWNWLSGFGAGGASDWIAPLLLLAVSVPVMVLLSLIAVAVLMTPQLVELVAKRRFAALERRGTAGALGMIGSAGWSAASVLLAALALVVSLPLWLIPPLILVVPPLIWGWLTYRVMAYDALSAHATAAERREVFAKHRGPLLAIGVVCGYLGAAPSIVWASGALFAAAFAVLIPLALWIYMLVFAFSSLWFTHYALQALQELRVKSVPPAAAPAAAPEPGTPVGPPPVLGGPVSSGHADKPFTNPF